MILSESAVNPGEDLARPEVNGKELTLSTNREDNCRLNGGEANRFFVNTNGACFLCRQQTSSLSSGFYYSYNGAEEKYNWEGGGCDNSSSCSSPGEVNRAALKQEPDSLAQLEFCHWNIFRYLNITPRSIAKCLEVEPEDGCSRLRLVARNDTDFSVLICGECSEVASNMSRLCEELELIQMRVDRCVESVREIITNSEKVPRDLLEKKRLTDGASEVDAKEESFHRTVADVLRKETKQKCINRLRQSRFSKRRKLAGVKKPRGNEAKAITIAKSAEVDVPVLEAKQEIQVDPQSHFNRFKMEVEVGQDQVLVLKGEKEEDDPLSSLSSSPPLAVQDLQTEWLDDSVPEVDQEISIDLCGGATSTTNDLLFDHLSSCLPPILETEQVSSSILEENELSTPVSLPSILNGSKFPPPPPPVNLPPKPPKKRSKKKKKADALLDEEKTSAGSGLAECPVDFYFHKKQDNRHLCPFCSDTSPTLTNLRFHVIRAHPEELFSTSRQSPQSSHIPVSDFKAACELMLFKVTKEAETGERNPSGTKVIVKCKFCSEEEAKVYHDKRAFQCHLILNHYPMLTQRLVDELHKFNNDNGELAADPVNNVGRESPSLSPPSSSSPVSGASTAAVKTKRSWVYKLNTKKHGGGDTGSPAKKRRESQESGSKSNQGSFTCEHCGKSLSSSTSKWRHKQMYCDVLRNRVDKSPVDIEPVTSLCSTIPSSNPTSVYLITPEGEIINRNGGAFLGGSTLTSGVTSTFSTTTGSCGGGGGVGIDMDTSFKDERIGLELLLQEANDMILKEDFDFSGGGGGGGSGSSEGTSTTDEYEQFVGDFQEFYDEDEVNDALLTMMMENVPGEDPLQI